MSGLAVLGLLLAAAPVLLLGIYTLEVAAGLPKPRPAAAEDRPAAETVVVVPAHDEAAGIAATVQALVAQAGPATRVLVVADNCADDTAARARAAGAEVVERRDAGRRGKGYALAFGREALAAAPPACVVVVDADCAIAPGGLERLAREAVARGRAMQSCNLQRPDPTAAPTAQISNFAFLVKNLVRQRGMARLGSVAALTGTGMAIPWPLFRDAPLASADLAEDMALGVWLVRQGQPPAYLETVNTWSDAASGRTLLTQRGRWERGFLRTARMQALPLVATGIARLSPSRLWLGLHLLVPPLALLFAFAGGVLLVVSALALRGGGVAPPLLLTGALTAASGATMLAWLGEGRAQVSGRALLRAPAYLMMKLPVYRAMLGRGQVSWVRTRRAGEHDRDD